MSDKDRSSHVDANPPSEHDIHQVKDAEGKTTDTQMDTHPGKIEEGTKPPEAKK